MILCISCNLADFAFDLVVGAAAGGFKAKKGICSSSSNALMHSPHSFLLLPPLAISSKVCVNSIMAGVPSVRPSASRLCNYVVRTSDAVTGKIPMIAF